jgi:signal transduction histidine kinase
LSGATLLLLVLAFVALDVVRGSDLRQENMDIATAMSKIQSIYAKQAGPVRHRIVFDAGDDVAIEVTNLAGTKVWATSRTIVGAPVVASPRTSSQSPIGLAVHLRSTTSAREFTQSLSNPHIGTITTPNGPGLVYGFAYGSTLQNDVTRVRWVVGVSFPLLFLLSGFLIWFTVGLALAPVESMRKKVRSFASSDLNQRVPVPAGNDEVARLAATLNEMLARLDAASQFQTTFISNAGHELRSPLTTLLATIEHAQAENQLDNWNLAGETVLREGRRLSAIVDNLFWLAKADDPTFTKHVSDVDVDDVLLAEATRVRLLTNLTVATSGVEATRIQGDAMMVARMIRNVVDNAMRYAETTLVFTARAEGDTVVVTVSNDGPGIDVASSAQFFERFARADEARSRDLGGSGLGLAVVQEVASQHDGDAAFVASTLGTTLQIRLARDSR